VAAIGFFAIFAENQQSYEKKVNPVSDVGAAVFVPYHEIRSDYNVPLSLDRGKSFLSQICV